MKHIIKKPSFMTAMRLLLIPFALSPVVSSANQNPVRAVSDGSDGALNITSPGTLKFDPLATRLDRDGDNIVD